MSAGKRFRLQTRSNRKGGGGAHFFENVILHAKLVIFTYKVRYVGSLYPTHPPSSIIYIAVVNDGGNGRM